MAFVKPFALTNVARALLVLRAGPVTSVQLRERYGSPTWLEKGLREAKNLGLLSCQATGEQYNWRYTLTDEGRSRCPSRRQMAMLDLLEHMRDVASDAELVTDEVGA